jgi:hypothetical protein
VVVGASHVNVTVLPLTDATRVPEAPGAASAPTRPWVRSVPIPVASHPFAEEKIPAVPAVRQLQVVVAAVSGPLAPAAGPATVSWPGEVGAGPF